MTSPSSQGVGNPEPIWPSAWSRYRLQPSEAECVATALCAIVGLVAVFVDPSRFPLGPALVPVALMIGATVTVLWLVRFLLVLARWTKRRRHLREHKLAWGLLPTLALALSVAALTQRGGGKVFDVEVWREVAIHSGDTTRWRMVEDLRRHHLQSGITRAAVLERMGPPDVGGWTSATLQWWLKPADGPGESWWLELQFEGGQLRDTFLVTR
jgi:hypothetical protein